MKNKTIIGTIHFQNLEMGFWGIIDNKGKHWLPTNLPPAFQQENKAIRAVVKLLKDDFSFTMWGKSVEIITIEAV